MAKFLHTATEMHPPSMQEFALRARKIEEQQAQTTETRVESRASVKKMGLFDLIVHLFGGPTLF